MAIIRGDFDSVDNFVTVPNVLARDKGLSLKARGLLVEMLSHRSGWRITQDSLLSEKDGKGAVGSAIRELVEAGILVVEQVKDENGRFRENDHILVGTRWSGPLAGFPSTVSPLMENPPLKKTNSLEDYLKDSCPPQKPRPKGEYSDDFEAWWSIYPKRSGKDKAYIAFRKALTETSLEYLMYGATKYREQFDERVLSDGKVQATKFCKMAQGWLTDQRWLDFDEPVSDLVRADELVASGSWREFERLVGDRLVVPWLGDGEVRWTANMSERQIIERKRAWWSDVRDEFLISPAC